MDERLALHDDYANQARQLEQHFAFSVTGVKETAVQRARLMGGLSRMVDDVQRGLNLAADMRRKGYRQLIDEITVASPRTGAYFANQPYSSEFDGYFSYAAELVTTRLDQDVSNRIAQVVRDIRQIALMSRSMQNNRQWDRSAALLRARESVENRLSVSADRRGREQRTERFSALLVRGLSVAMMVDSTVLHGASDRYRLFSFDADDLGELTAAEFHERRGELFHPQSRRFLVPTS